MAAFGVLVLFQLVFLVNYAPYVAGYRTNTDIFPDIHVGISIHVKARGFPNSADGDVQPQSRQLDVQGAGQKSPAEEGHDVKQTGVKPSTPDMGVGFVLYGATGDNALRSKGLFSALYELFCAGALEHVTIFAHATQDELKEDAVAVRVQKAKKNLEPLSIQFGETCPFDKFWHGGKIVWVPSMAISWSDSMVKEPGFTLDDLRHLHRKVQLGNYGTWIFYLSVWEGLFGQYSMGIKRLYDESATNMTRLRLVVEKPLGTNSTTYAALQAKFDAAGLKEENLYRVDHYLHKEIMVRWPLFRSANAASLNICLTADCIKKVRVVQTEARDLAGRNIDQIGQVRDMIQSHLLQVLAVFTAAGPELVRDADVFRRKKVEMLESMTISQMKLAQYEGYMSDGKGTARRPSSPTYAFATIQMSAPEWQGVEFEIETGKALDRSETYVEAWSKGGQLLRLHIQPDPRIEVTPMVPEVSPGAVNEVLPVTIFYKPPGLDKPQVETKSMTHSDPRDDTLYEAAKFTKGGYIPEAYAYAMDQLIQGDQRNFLRHEEVMAQWKLCDEFLEGGGGEHLPLYPKNSHPYFVRAKALAMRRV